MPHRQGFPNWQQAPHPRLIKERVAGLARPRQPGNTLLYSFLGRGGEEEKDREDDACVWECRGRQPFAGARGVLASSLLRAAAGGKRAFAPALPHRQLWVHEI